MGIYYIILGIIFLIVLALWWAFESGVLFEAMEDYYRGKDIPVKKQLDKKD